MEKDKVNDQMEILLQKYAGGRIPPLAVQNDPKLGLVDGELLTIYQKGFAGKNFIPLGILLAAENYSAPEEKWTKGNYHFNEWAKADWTSFCMRVRSNDTGDKACVNCDRHRAIIAEKEGRVIAHLCDNGLIDFAMPVFVGTEVIAVIFTGQRKPKEGAIWNPEIIIQPDGLFRPLAPGEKGVDAWAECRKRIRAVENRLGFERDALIRDFIKEVDEKPEIEVSPQNVEEIMRVLENAGTQLSHLATSMFESEKSKIVGWIRGSIVHSLASLSAESSSTPGVWRALSDSLEHLCVYFGLDYILSLSCSEDGGTISLLYQYGLPEAGFPMEKHQCSEKSESLYRLMSAIRGWNNIAEMELSEYADLPILDKLNSVIPQQESRQVLGVPMAPPWMTPSIIILGNIDKDIIFSPHDKDALSAIIGDIVLATEIVLLINQLADLAIELQLVSERQAAFIEDVAHDIRNPIQNIITMADLLRSGFLFHDEIPDQVKKLAAEARRLHLTSQRIWTLERIRVNHYTLDEVRVPIYQVIMECRQSLIDLAEERKIRISVDRSLGGWPAIQLDRELFMQAVLNLMDNAVKYSYDGTEVRIDGKRMLDGVSISFVNRGIQIRDEDKQRIFERYYRTKEALMYTGSGMGTGLSIVKAFADFYGSIDVECTPIGIPGQYITEFILFIEER